MSMNISQLFVTKRPIAWTAMISVLAWGIYAYLMMPQRQDPIIPVVSASSSRRHPGMLEAEKVEQESHLAQDRAPGSREPRGGACEIHQPAGHLRCLRRALRN